jgi:hypothetical protein
MPTCEISYIPERLHSLDRPPINKFAVGELLYFRCTSEELDNPFTKISIAELSHNRSGEHGSLGGQDDVLFNILPGNNFERYPGLEICTLQIVELKEDGTYSKDFQQEKNQQLHNANLQLIHDPLPCMYPHCVFRVTLDGTLITKSNFKDTIGKLKEIKNKIKQEIASMILIKEVSQNSG